MYRGVRAALRARTIDRAVSLGVGALVIATALSSLPSVSDAAQPAYRQKAIAGFNPVQVAYNSRPALVDLDADGDLDIVLGNADGRLVYFRNDIVKFVPQFGTASPFSGVTVGKEPRPAFGDLDGDLDMDAVIGQSDGTLRYLLNIGSTTQPDFAEQLGAGNPFDGLFLDDSAAPNLADMDADSDLDLVVGGADGKLSFFSNEGVGGFQQRTGIENPFDSVDAGLLSAPELEDLDDDDDLDLIVGGLDGILRYYRNEGSPVVATFQALTEDDNPFDALDVGFLSSPTAADLDDDGDFDVVSGEEYGELHYFQNSGTAADPIYSELEGAINPFFGFDTGYHASFALGDLDEDSDADVIAGEIRGRLQVLDNLGDAGLPVFAVQDPNPLANRDVGYFSMPALGDLDNDSDLDLVVGDYYGNFRLFENTTTTLTPEFVERTGANNPLAGFDVGASAAPTLVDIDDDGDLDILSGDYLGGITFLENIGSSSTAEFMPATDNNPVAGLDLGSRTKPVAVDLDGDGDVDLIVGEETSRQLNFLENTGSPDAPVFTLRLGVQNPFTGIDVGDNAAPAAWDLDGDADQDLLVGREEPGILYLEAFNAAPELDISGAPFLDPIPEDIQPDLNFGITITALLNRTAAASDANAGTRLGAAVVGADELQGAWQYQLQGGLWQSLVGISDSAAVLLDAAASLRFQPGPDFNGLSQVLIRAWDESDGEPGDSSVDTSGLNSGGETAFSATVESVSITIDPVNDPPVNLRRARITGSSDVGQSLNVTPGSWSDVIDVAPGNLSFTYQWYRTDNIVTSIPQPIAGATSLSYIVTLDDLNRYLRVVETVTDDGEGVPVSTVASAPSGFIGVPDPLFADDFELDKPEEE